MLVVYITVSRFLSSPEDCTFVEHGRQVTSLFSQSDAIMCNCSAAYLGTSRAYLKKLVSLRKIRVG